MNALRSILLAALALAVYFSHELCFLALVISIFWLALVKQTEERSRNLALTAVAFVPSIALLAIYTYMTTGGHPVGPLDLTLAPANGWLTQIRTANPFMIVLTRNLPFADASSYAPIFAPVSWFAVAIACLVLGRRAVANAEKSSASRMRFAFLALCILFVVGAILAPEALAGGSIIRPRMTLFAAIALVPFISGPLRRPYRLTATVILALVFAFQCAALWDYSLATSADAEEILASAGPAADGQGVVVVTVAPVIPRYPTAPLRHVDGFMNESGYSVVPGVYEFALPSFPVTALTESDRALISRFDYDSYVVGSEDIDRLARDLEDAHERVATVVLWNADDSVTRALEKWYEPVASSSSGKARVFRRRS